MRLLLFLLLFASAIRPAEAQPEARAEAALEGSGSWLFASIALGQTAHGRSANNCLKGLVVRVGEARQANVCYDLDRCRMAGGWRGAEVKNPGGEAPVGSNEPDFATGESAGFLLKAVAWQDLREEPVGPNPGVQFRGLFVHGQRVVLRWMVGVTEVLESPGFEQRQGMDVYTRTFTIAPAREPVRIVVSRLPKGGPVEIQEGTTFFSAKDNSPLIERTGFTKYLDATRVMVVTDFALPEGAEWKQIDGHLVVEIPPQPTPAHFRLLVGSGPEKLDTLPALTHEPPLEDLAAWCLGGPARWPDQAETSGARAASDEEPYEVDTICSPDPGLLFTGLDFFPDGRAALCTEQGDVFIVSGLDETLAHVRWKRFAAGLDRPAGLKIVKGEIYVSGHEGITRLRDLNGDGEADAYDAFNRDLAVTAYGQDGAVDLQTDPAGNFYFATGGVAAASGLIDGRIGQHPGCLLRVSPDGQKMEIIATGFRAPGGVAVGPFGELTVSDRLDAGSPVTRLNWITPGGFYGAGSVAHRSQPAAGGDRPLCWLPREVDANPGGEVWVESAKWGPWNGHLLHLSRGRNALYGVMMEGVQIPEAPDCCSHVMQGGVVKFPMPLESGPLRARFNPADGQLYLAGSGDVQRVRYTGRPVAMPLELSAQKEGIQLKFGVSLDTQQACDPANWQVEFWDYRSPGAESTPTKMDVPSRLPLSVKAVAMGTDDRTVFLELPGLKPVMQMSIRYRLRTAVGAPLAGEITSTVNALQPEQ